MGKVLEFLWSQWNTLTAGGSTKLTADQWNAIQNGIHIQDVNLDAMKASLLVGDLTTSRSSSGPIPGTGQVVETVDTTGSGSPVSTLLTPKPGEAYLISGGTWSTKNASSFYLYVYDGDGSTRTYVDYKTSAGILEVSGPGPLIICHPQTLRALYGSATGDNSTTLAWCRVR
jgi:hypothetical protein